MFLSNRIFAEIWYETYSMNFVDIAQNSNGNSAQFGVGGHRWHHPMEILGAVTWDPKIWKCRGNTGWILYFKENHIVWIPGPYGSIYQILPQIDAIWPQIMTYDILIWILPGPEKIF